MTDRERHLDLLADAVIAGVKWQDQSEYWGLDGKRPFGFSSIEVSILDIIGAEPTNEDNDYSYQQVDYANDLFMDVADHIRTRWVEMRRQNR